MVNTKKNSRVEYLDQVISIMGSAYGVQERAPGPGLKLQALTKLANSCIGQSSFKLQAASILSLTGPWIRDRVGLRKMKRALMRSSMRAAQGPWLRDENIAPGIARHWRPRTRVTNYLLNLKPQAPSLLRYKPQASSPKQQASSFKPQASSSMILDPRYI